SFLPGRLILSRGHCEDYVALCRFHYRPRPATIAQLWTIRHETTPAAYLDTVTGHSVVISLAILSYPVLASTARDAALNLGGLSARRKVNFINDHLTTISRVIVHPTFRGLGLGTTLVRCLLYHSPTRFTEAFAQMGRAHPLFVRAGMCEYAA